MFINSKNIAYKLKTRSSIAVFLLGVIIILCFLAVFSGIVERIGIEWNYSSLIGMAQIFQLKHNNLAKNGVLLV